MSYYIAPQSECMVELGEIVVYRVVKRLSDFKPEEGKLYRVFKSKKDMEECMYIPTYRGVNGKLKKSKSEFVLRF